MIEFINVEKIYPGASEKAVSDFNLKIEDGDFVCIIGTSGSGKTTTMRMINRMTEHTSGQVLIDGEDVMDQDPVELRRRIGYVIQNVGLMPHLTIRDNITMVPRLLGWSEERQDETARRLIGLAELPESYLDNYPHELSGGQQQRVGVVRALAADQDIILMDEPLGALDPITRDSLQELIKGLQENLGKTIVFVTHDMDEALHMATKIVIMSHGEIVQVGTPAEILNNPANDFVREFIGQDRLIETSADVTTIKEVMNENPVTVTPGESLQDALRLMRDRRVDSVLVVDKQNYLKGIVELADIQRRARSATSVSDIMRTDLYTVNQNALIRETVQKILRRGISHIPIVNDFYQLVGIVTRGTLVDVVYNAIWGDSSEVTEESTEAYPTSEDIENLSEEE